MSMKPQPQQSTNDNRGPRKRLKGAADLATDRLGPLDSLSVVQETVYDLAQHYAEEVGLAEAFETDPEVSVTAIQLAYARYKEMTLMQEIERALHRTSLDQDTDYGDALFQTVQNESQLTANRELDRLHTLGDARRGQLEKLSKKRKFAKE